MESWMKWDKWQSSTKVVHPWNKFLDLKYFKNKKKRKTFTLAFTFSFKCDFKSSDYKFLLCFKYSSIFFLKWLFEKQLMKQTNHNATTTKMVHFIFCREYINEVLFSKKFCCSIFVFVGFFINFVMAFEHRKLRHLICYAFWFSLQTNAFAALSKLNLLCNRNIVFMVHIL